VADQNKPIGVLLLNLGTPDSPAVGDVRRYLRQFLGDPRVINLPQPLRWLLLNLVILPFRPRRSAAAYRLIWMPEGSPLLHYGRGLTAGVSAGLGDDFRVELAMRYGSPSIEQGLTALLATDPASIVILPLFPQYAIASTGSALAEVDRVLKSIDAPPPVITIDAFYEHPSFIGAMATVAKPVLEQFDPDHVVMSFHGLPEWQVRELDTSGRHCLEKPDCCEHIGAENRSCYRAHCFATARALEAALGLKEQNTSLVFQSRLGRTPWLEPDLIDVLPQLAAQGVKRPAVFCPAFVADCLETIEEVGIRARAQWKELGGEDLCLVPCVNANPVWVDGVVSMIRETVDVEGRR
jgi:ferrochelatase